LSRTRPFAPTLVAIAALAAFAGLSYDGFLSAAVLVDVLDAGAVLGFAALGAMLVLSSGSIDLSVGAVMALSSVVVAELVEGGAPPALALLVVLALGLAIGGAVGWLVDALELPALIVTLGAMFLARGAALAIHVESRSIREAGWNAWTGVELLGVDLAACAWIAAAAWAAWALRHSRTLRAALAIGGDERTASYFGVRVRRTRVGIHALGAACSALAGFAFALYSSKGDSTAGVGLELDAIAAAVIGGTALRGGVASAVGACLGALMLGLLQTMLVFEGVPGAGWTRIVLGGLLLAFLVAQRGLEHRAGA
jgi:ribose/xylose/arabinose/galactoside ABC-type transport system permease subunit